MTDDPNRKTYFSTIDKAGQDLLINNMQKLQLGIYLWEEGQEEEDLQKFNFHSYDSPNNTIFLTYMGKILSRLLGSSLAGKKVYLKITHNRVKFFTYGELTHNKATNIYHFIPKHDFYKGQQRSDYRLISSDKIRIQVKLDKDIHECFDLSASGISLLLPILSKDKFTVGTVYEKSTIRLRTKDFSIEKIQVKGVFTKKEKPEVEEGMVKIGMVFSKIDQTEEQKLFLAINTEARAAEIQKKFAKK